MSKTNSTYDIEWLGAIGISAGTKGTATGSSSTSLTNSGASWGTTAYVGCMVVAQPASGGLVYANIISHTATVLTVDRWYDATSPGGSAGTTPSATGQYVIIPGSAPNMFVGISTSTAAVGSGDTTLVGELATGALIRKIGTLTHTAGTNSGTVSAVFTANGTETNLSNGITVGKMGISSSISSSQPNLFQSLLSATATLNASGDQLTVTDTISL